MLVQCQGFPSFSQRPASEGRGGPKELEGDTAGTAGPGWPGGCPIACVPRRTVKTGRVGWGLGQLLLRDCLGISQPVVSNRVYIYTHRKPVIIISLAGKKRKGK